MDITMQMRSVELLVKFLKHDLHSIPSYGYCLQKGAYVPALRPSVPLARSTPEAEGMRSEDILRFFKRINASVDEIAAHGVLLVRHNRIIAEGFWAPYRADAPYMLYSMSKSITATAIGMAVDEGLVSLDERLSDIFPEYVSYAQARILRAHKVRHLLTMSTGIRFNEIGSMLDGKWAKMFMESTPKFEAGTAFDYNSLNSYMLAAIIARRTGDSLSEYLKPRLFMPLGIGEYAWEVCPEGIEKGGWGLSLRAEDVAKVALLYLNGGMWEGRRILSEEWVRAATSKQIDTPNGEMKFGYGYHIWLGDDEGSFQFNGAFGQYAVAMPKYDALAVILSGSAKLFAQGDLTRYIADCFKGASDAPLEENPGARGKLAKYLNDLRFEPTLAEPLGTDPDEFERIACMLDGREYRFEGNIGGVFPQTIQAVHGNYTMGLDMVRFERTRAGLDVTLYEYSERNRLAVRADGGLEESCVAMRGEWHGVGTRGVWKLDGDRVRMTLVASFIETPNTRILRFDLNDGRMEVIFEELPELNKTIDMLFELAGVSEMTFFKRLVPVMHSENLGAAMRQLVVPTARGTLVARNDATPLVAATGDVPVARGDEKAS